MTTRPDRWATVERLYHATLARPVDERTAFLAAACAGDEELRREVESLLAQQASADGVLSGGAVVAAAGLVSNVGHSTPTGGRIGAYQSLIAGTRLGPYEILAPIGAGAMGEVYKARDTRLGRVVAIKSLKDQFSERFEREARAVAALNHPNICQLYDIGPNYLVIEFVEGVPIRPEESPQKLLDLASQIADGLAAAHAAGIVHRDLKPGNILVNRSGQVKILDFGLAMIRPDSMEAADARTTEFITGTGLTVGTVAYMSPEQARGELVDARSDLFSFGVLLYEMATRVRPFDGETSAIVFESLLGKSPVPVRERNPKVSPEVERIIGRLLEKDRETRYQSAADVRADLKRVGRDSGSGGVAAVTAPTHTPRRVLKSVIAVFALVSLAGVVALFYPGRPSTPVTLPAEYTQLTNFIDSATSPSFSPNGQMLTFIRGGEFCCSNDGGQGQVYVKLLPNGESVQLTNDAGAKFGPVFTPDGSRITYTVWAAAPGWNTWTVPAFGGAPTLYFPNAFGLTWISGQQVMFSEIMTGTLLHMGLVTATESRAEPRDIYFPEHERAMAHFSHLSPDHKSVLIVEMDRTAAWQPCRLVPFDGSSAGRQVGPPGQCKSTGWSPDGKWMYFSVMVADSSHLWRQRFPDGAPEQITFGPNEEEGVAVAPDGQSLVTSVGARQAAIWIHDAGGERAISSEGYAFAPRLSRDGQRLFYLLRRDASASVSELRSLNLASGKSESVLPGFSVRDYDISLDEKEVAFTSTASDGQSQIWLASFDRRAAPRQIAHSGYSVSFGTKDELVFLQLDKKVNYLYRINKDGTGLERITDTPIQNKGGLSHDGEWVLAVAEGFMAIPVHGGTSRKMPIGVWSLDGRVFYVQPPGSYSTAGGGKTYAIPVPAGKTLPDLPALESDWAKLPGVQIIPHGAVSPGPDPSMYAFTRTELKRNLFRIPLH